MQLGSFRSRLTVLVGAFLVASLARPVAAEVSWRPLGEEIAVNVQTFGDQSYPAAAIDAAGNVFVVWMDHQWQGIRGRVYDAAGLPVTGEIKISANMREVHFQAQPRVAVLGNGDFVVVWSSDSRQGFRLRRFNALGQPLSDTISVYDVPLETVLDPDIASDPAGGYVLTWTSWLSSSFRVLAQRFDADGAPRSGAFLVSPDSGGRKDRPRVAVDPASGSFLIVWIDERETGNPDVWARRFTSSGQPQGPEFLVNTEKSGEALGAVPVFHGGGSSVVWSNVDRQWEIVAQHFDGAGARVGPAVLLSEAPGFYSIYPALAVAITPGGGLLLLWAGPDPRGADPYEIVPNAAVLGRLFDNSWQPASAPFEVNTYVPWSQTEPAVVVDGQGRFSAFWGSGEELYFPTSPPRDPRGQDGDAFGIFGQRFTLAGCEPADDHLCLGNRFTVQATWKNPYTGETGIGHGHPLTADTGALWFFDPANLELMVKVLDGRAINGSFWVFYGALSNVEYTLTVTDTQTGAVRTYHNPPLQYASRSDTSAFPDTGSAGLAKAVAPAPPVEIAGKAACVPSATALCLGAGRFAAEVVWTDPRTGLSAQARALPLTADTGAFWFVDATNLELMIKVLDGRGINGRFWVFFGALSDLDYTVTVTDRETGKQRTYHNDRHQLASRADTAAF